MKRVAPELMHLTLAFIGWAAEDAAPRAARALRSSMSATSSVACRLGDAGAFPTPTRPRVVWVGLADGGDGVRECALAAREALRSAEIEYDDKPPLAHLTVARVREGVSRSARDEIAAAVRGARVEPLRFEIAEVVLFESRLARSGPTYIPLERVPLHARLPSAPHER